MYSVMLDLESTIHNHINTHIAAGVNAKVRVWPLNMLHTEARGMPPYPWVADMPVSHVSFSTGEPRSTDSADCTLLVHAGPTSTTSIEGCVLSYCWRSSNTHTYLLSNLEGHGATAVEESRANHSQVKPPTHGWLGCVCAAPARVETIHASCRMAGDTAAGSDFEEVPLRKACRLTDSTLHTHTVPTHCRETTPKPTTF